MEHVGRDHLGVVSSSAHSFQASFFSTWVTAPGPQKTRSGPDPGPSRSGLGVDPGGATMEGDLGE